ncbi:GDYXXLXY domain-containing protein [Aeromonas jandaei]|uniref:GDYXXLXY domain-containing protein n=1 Tax=Aeromonas jandaei TaxID=650 RepID=UPI0038CF5592
MHPSLHLPFCHSPNTKVIHRSDRQWLIGPDAFFFEEGDGEALSRARYGEFRLQPDGKTLLVGLRDEAYQPIGRSRSRW